MILDDYDVLYSVLEDSDYGIVLKETGEMIRDFGLTMQVINGQIKPEIGYHILVECIFG